MLIHSLTCGLDETTQIQGRREFELRLGVSEGDGSRCSVTALHHRFAPSGAPKAGRIAIAFLAIVAVAQLVFLTVGCDWDLAGDEAEYWAWSRKLDWSYYAKGPLIAIVIRASTAVVGPLSVAVTGSSMAAVRLPAILLGALTGWGVFRLTRETIKDPAAALLAVLVLPAIPLFRIGGLIITIDTPLVCCWIWAAVWAFRAIARDRWAAWTTAGVIAGVGVTAKYTMLALPASVGVFLLLSPRHRVQLVRPRFWLLSALCGLGLAPIIAWNAVHGWVGADQLAHRLGFLPSDMAVQSATPASSTVFGRLISLLTFLSGEVAVLGPWWFAAVAAALAAVVVLGREWRARRSAPSRVERAPSATHRRDLREPTEGLLFLLALWVVVWLACVAVSLLGESEPNWAAPAYSALVCLMGWWMSKAWRRPLGRWVLASTWVVSMLSLSAVQGSEWFYPTIAKWIPEPSKTRAVPMRHVDPTCRFRGSRELASDVGARFAALRSQGLDPFILTPTYTLASNLSFHLPGQPEVFCLSWSPGMPLRAVNQHDLWRPNPRFDSAAFQGRPAIVVAEAQPTVNFARAMVREHLFRHAYPTERITAQRSSVVVGAWDVTICADYRGLAAARRK
jgi:4-amino-4-deoxy-L-arabinose transferase-like glycosyltransferase